MLNIEPGPGEDGWEDGEEYADEDELALRRMLHGAVSGIEPSAGALDHLRHAVPARRARKRQALVGAAAAVVLIGTAVPAFVHVAGSGGMSAAQPAKASHGSQAPGGTGDNGATEGGGATKAPAVTVSPSQGPDSATGKGGGRPDASGGPRQTGGSGGGPGGTGGSGGTGGGSGGTGGSAGEGDGSGPAVACTADDLGVGGAQAGSPDAEGVVYGSFRMINVSGTPCRIDGGGTMTFAAQGAADPGRISVQRHFSGGPASGLPDPSQESSALILPSGGSYRVQFAWVPSETCPTATTPPPTEQPSTPPPSPEPGGGDPSADAGGAEGGGAGADSGMGAQLLSAEGRVDGSVLLGHTPEPGGAMAYTTIPDACAGTIYRTGLLSD